jgi:hypothetical protein
MINLDLHCHDETIEAALYKKDPVCFSRYAPPTETREVDYE